MMVVQIHMAHWKMESVPWAQFDPEKANPDHIVLAKTASVVEYNSADYVAYLCNVFSDDEEFQKAAHQWGEEERQHGLAMAKWAKLADPSFDFEAALARFRDAFRIQVDATQSIRGSRVGELVARCIVECGTTMYYSALRDASDEPVFKAICHNIAVDEVLHYSLFYKTMQKYLRMEPTSRFQRFRIAVSRGFEVEDEELLFAYAASNLREDIRIERKPVYLQEYMGRTYGLYTQKHLLKGMTMACRAAGLEKIPRLPQFVATLVHRFMQSKAERLNASKTYVSRALRTDAHLTEQRSN